MCFSVIAVARLDTPAVGDWSGYNCRVVHSCGLQHWREEHTSTRKATGILYAEVGLNVVAETYDIPFLNSFAMFSCTLLANLKYL